ncbi:hypothetical protein M422DRAFT_241149 [Sphaerobolus stellatus SS14]|nr:hypothetical protein M422DRAFT_241149 [Sphaerobolus stellatus SS14]
MSTSPFCVDPPIEYIDDGPLMGEIGEPQAPPTSTDASVESTSAEDPSSTIPVPSIGTPTIPPAVPAIASAPGPTIVPATEQLKEPTLPTATILITVPHKRAAKEDEPAKTKTSRGLRFSKKSKVTDGSDISSGSSNAGAAFALALAHQTPTPTFSLSVPTPTVNAGPTVTANPTPPIPNPTPFTELSVPPEMIPRIMPRPPQGDPEVFGMELKELYIQAHHESTDMWQHESGEKMILYPKDPTPRDPTTIILKTRRFLQDLLPHRDISTLIVGAPCLVNISVAYRPAFPIFIGRLSAPEKRLLMSRNVWVTPSIQLFTRDFIPPPSSWVMTLRSLPFLPDTNTETGNNALVQLVVRRKIHNTVAISAFIMKHYDNLPAGLSPNGAVNHVVNSVHISGLPVIINGEQKWLSLMRNNVYTMVQGAGFPLKPSYHCSVCKGLDHPTGLCPFTTLPGWVEGPVNDTDNGPDGDSQPGGDIISFPNDIHFPKDINRPNNSATRGGGGGRGRGFSGRHKNGNSRGNSRGGYWGNNRGKRH